MVPHNHGQPEHALDPFPVDTVRKVGTMARLESGKASRRIRSRTISDMSGLPMIMQRQPPSTVAPKGDESFSVGSPSGLRSSVNKSSPAA